MVPGHIPTIRHEPRDVADGAGRGLGKDGS